MDKQRASSELTIGKGGDRVLTPKGGQGSIRKDAKAGLEDPGNAESMLSHQGSGSGHGRAGTRTSIVSRKRSPERVPKAVRNRPAIESGLHWVLGVRMREGELRTRTDRGPETLAGIRRPVRSMARLVDDSPSTRGQLLQAPECRPALVGAAAKLAEEL